MRDASGYIAERCELPLGHQGSFQLNLLLHDAASLERVAGLAGDVEQDRFEVIEVFTRAGIHPKNAGQPVFIPERNDVVVRDLREDPDPGGIPHLQPMEEPFGTCLQ